MSWIWGAPHGDGVVVIKMDPCCCQEFPWWGDKFFKAVALICCWLAQTVSIPSHEVINKTREHVSANQSAFFLKAASLVWLKLFFVLKYCTHKGIYKTWVPTTALIWRKIGMRSGSKFFQNLTSKRWGLNRPLLETASTRANIGPLVEINPTVW